MISISSILLFGIILGLGFLGMYNANKEYEERAKRQRELDIFFRHKATMTERWRDQFNQELAKLDTLSSDNRIGADVIGIAARIPKDVRKGSLLFDTVIVMSTSESGVQIKWQDWHREFSVFIYPDRTLEYLFKDADGKYTSGPLRSVYQINEVIG